MKTHQTQTPRRTLFASALLTLALLAGITPRAANAAPLGTAFTYQGLLTERGTPATGLYDLRFNIYTMEMGGSAVIAPPLLVAPGLVKSGVPVTNGMFTTVIDFGSVYDGTAYWLEIEAHPNGSAAEFQLLTPRQELTLSPYAIFATTASIATSIAGNAIAAGNLQNDAVTAAKIALPLSLAHDDPFFPTLGVRNSSGNGVEGHSTSAIGVSGYSDSFDGVYGESPRNGVHGASASATGNGVRGENTGNGVGVWGKSASFEGVHGETSANNAAAVAGVNANTASGSGVYGESRGAGVGVWGKSASFEGVHGETSANNAAAVAGVNANTASGSGVYGESRGAGVGVWGKSASFEGVHGETSANNAAAVAGINANTTAGVGVYGENRGSGVGVWGKSVTFEGVHGESSSGNAAAIAGINLSTGPGVYGESRGGGYGGYFVGRVRVAVLEIAGGADLAEPFTMSSAGILEGAVVIIDEENPGKLRLSERAYDTRVAGIVSGANGIKPGISLSQEGTIEGGQNVALSGRVYVLADASSGSIKPGDLLTSSSIPGHAMKVTEHDKAQGAIIGKAMSSLKEGKGMVLVLVTLQ